jgi:hypothetical protein
MCGYIVNLGQSSGKPLCPRHGAAQFAGQFVTYARTIFKIQIGRFKF